MDFRTFPSSPKSLFQSESKCEIFVMVISSNFNIVWNLIFLTKTSHLALLWNGGWGKLGNGLLCHYFNDEDDGDDNNNDKNIINNHHQYHIKFCLYPIMIIAYTHLWDILIWVIKTLFLLRGEIGVHKKNPESCQHGLKLTPGIIIVRVLLIVVHQSDSI